MIIKHARAKDGAKSSIGKLIAYISDAQQKNERVGTITATNFVTNGRSLEELKQEAEQVQALNTRSKDKTYHLIISFAPGEHPDQKILKEIESRIVEKIGFKDHQRVSAVHTDTDSLHIHLAINKINPKTRTVKDPYRAYDAFADLCRAFEAEYGLQKTNHQPTQTVAQSKIQDIERKGDIESLATWIKKNCLEKIKTAQTWNDVHQALSETGVTLQKRGNGFVFLTDEGLAVKGSTIDRTLSKAALEKRLGAFEENRMAKADSQKKYEKFSGRDVSPKLWELYQTEYKDQMKAVAIERKNLLGLSREERNQDVSAAYGAFKLRQAAIKLMKPNPLLRKVLSSQARETLNRSLEAAKKAEQQRNSTYRDKATRPHKAGWLDWLSKQAASGNQEALEALQKRRKAGLQGETIQASGEPLNKMTLPIDSVTKTGTIIYQNKGGAIRDDGAKLQVAKNSQDAAVLTALELARSKYGRTLTVTGSDAFKSQLIRVAAKSNIDVVFADTTMESKRQEEREKNERTRRGERGDRKLDAANASRTARGGISADGDRGRSDNRRTERVSRRGGGRATATPDIRSIGRSPPPVSQNRLRGLPQLGLVQFEEGSKMLLQGNVSGDMDKQRTGIHNTMRRTMDRIDDKIKHNPDITKEHILSVEKYIVERMEKKEKGLGVPEHDFLDFSKKQNLVFAGVRKIESYSMALFKNPNDPEAKTFVLPITEEQASELKTAKIGKSVEISDEGKITAQHRKGRTV